MTSSSRSRAETAPDQREVLYRRAPSVPAFLIAGLVIGLVLAVFSTILGPVDQLYTAGAVFGVVAVIFGTVGAVLGALLGLFLDRRSRKRAERFYAVPVEDEDQHPAS